MICRDEFYQHFFYSKKRENSYKCFLDDLKRCEELGLELYNFQYASNFFFYSDFFLIITEKVQALPLVPQQLKTPSVSLRSVLTERTKKLKL